MVFVLLAALVCAAYVGIARCSQYGDYAAAKMPQYGSEEYHESAHDLAPIGDDYQDRSPEAPASPDYKYEEDLNLKSPNVNNDEQWRKTTERSPRYQRPESNRHPKGSKYHDIEKLKPKVKQSLRRHSKWRNLDRSVKINKIPLNGGRIKSNDIIDREDNDSNEELYHARFNEEKKYESTAEKVIRRKPRDRSIISTEADSEDVDDDDEDEGKNEVADAKDEEYAAEDSPVPKERLSESVERNDENAERLSSLRMDDDIIARLEASKLEQKAEGEYQDYYDMKRVNNIKKKITVLYRRTKARATGSAPSRRVQVWTYRRSYVLDRYSIPTTDEQDPPTRTTNYRTRTKKRNQIKDQKEKHIKVIPISESRMDSKIITRTTSLPPQLSLGQSETAFDQVQLSTPNSSTVMSLAEKSRLSILKKALLKESLMDKSTVKPPVLLQVTQQMNTVVMVEPSKPVNMHLVGNLARAFTDSPERLARVKKVMRRKLVAGARSIKDLTDNWDETICDYVDLSLLDGVKTNIASLNLVLGLIFTLMVVPFLDVLVCF